MTRENIINIIGEPEWFGYGDETSKMTADMWLYGNIEFSFNFLSPGVDKLGMIFTDNLYNFNGGNIFDIDPWIFKHRNHFIRRKNEKKFLFSTITLDYFLSIIDDKIKYKKNINSEEQILLELENGITIGFNIDYSRENDNNFYASAIYSSFINLYEKNE
ncbi:MAG: hypothetical protein U0457_21755 [Candidatus Sericytochromatia bacterium]